MGERMGRPTAVVELSGVERETTSGAEPTVQASRAPRCPTRSQPSAVPAVHP